MRRPPLTPLRADRVLDAAAAPRARLIWTAAGIAQRLGCSTDFVRGPLLAEAGTPIRKIGGRYVAEETALLEFFQNRR
jgi:hypothetical protein